MQDLEDFLNSYDGEDSQAAIGWYEFSRFRAEAALDIYGELGPDDARQLLEQSAWELVLAETIGYRYQALNRKPILKDAIFIEDLDHAEYNFTPGGSVSYRRDWMDREDALVKAFLSERYPLLADYFSGE